MAEKTYLKDSLGNPILSAQQIADINKGAKRTPVTLDDEEPKPKKAKAPATKKSK